VGVMGAEVGDEAAVLAGCALCNNATW